MAKDYEQFRKEYADLKNKMASAIEPYTKFNLSTTNLDALLKGATHELGVRVQELKDGGATGKELKDFLGDGEVKKIKAEIDNAVAQLEARRKTAASGNGAARALIQKMQDLRKTVDKEIAERKKQLSTKLGTGNKSLPDMVKLLAEIDASLDSDDRAKGGAKALRRALEDLDEQDANTWREEADGMIASALARTKADNKAKQAEEVASGVFKPQHIAASAARINKLAEVVTNQCDLAGKAAKARNPKDLLAAKMFAAKALKELNDLVETFEDGLKDKQNVVWMAKEKNKKSAAVITAAVDRMRKTRAVAGSAYKSVASLKVG